MAAITTGAHPKALWPGIYAWWGRSYAEHVPEFPDLFETETSTKAYEEEVEITGFGLAPVKPQGKQIYYDTETQGAVSRYTHVAYALGYIVTYEELRDDLYEVVSRRRAQQLAYSMRQTKENILAAVYNQGFDATSLGADGVPLFSASHPTLSGNQSNVLATPADLSEAAVEDMCIQIMQTTNNRGLKISSLPQSLHVPTQLFFDANRIYNSVLQNDTANNAVNVLKAVGVFPKGIKVNHYFSSATAWFVRTNIPRSLQYFSRDAISFDQDNDFDTKNAKAACYERYSAFWSDFRGVYGSAGV
ncbi:MAG TPA: hypothetical protein VMV33_17170 [Rhodocyclaceae bacterium]|nr:hypothetical protein [Rhodocyclaceae bacterium]